MKPGPKPTPIDLKQLQSLCEIQCTDVEIGHFFGIDVSTVERHRARSKEFRETCEKGRAIGRISLRRKQLQAAVDGNPTMLIWMGKQLLGQRDVIATEFSGPEGRPAELNVHHTSARELIASRIA